MRAESGGAAAAAAAVGRAGGKGTMATRLLPPVPASRAWTKEDEEYARWTCKSRECDGSKEFHKKCLLRRPISATASGRRTGVGSEGSSSSSAAVAMAMPTAGATAQSDSSTKVGAMDSDDDQYRAAASMCNSETETETEGEDAKSMCRRKRTSKNSGSGAAAVVVARAPPLSSVNSAEATAAEEGASATGGPDDCGGGGGDGGGGHSDRRGRTSASGDDNNTPPPPARDLQSAVDSVLRPAGSHRGHQRHEPLAAVEHAPQKSSNAGDIGGTGTSSGSGADGSVGVGDSGGGGGGSGNGGGNNVEDGGEESFGSLEHEFELEDRVTDGRVSRDDGDDDHDDAGDDGNTRASTVTPAAVTADAVVALSAARPFRVLSSGTRVSMGAACGVVDVVDASMGGVMSSECSEGERLAETGTAEGGLSGCSGSEVDVDLLCPLCQGVVATAAQVVAATHE